MPQDIMFKNRALNIKPFQINYRDSKARNGMSLVLPLGRGGVFIFLSSNYILLTTLHIGGGGRVQAYVNYMYHL